jgi:hypothetical protein
MRRFNQLIPTLLFALMLAGTAQAGSTQDGVGDDGSPPSSLNVGDENARGAFGGPAHLELRDIPTTASGAPSLYGARFMRVTSRVGSDGVYKFIDADFVCGDDAVADPCSTEMSCTPGSGKKTVCETVMVVDIRKAVEIQAVAASLLIPRIVAAFGLGSETLEVTKLKKYVQGGPLGDLDGVLSFKAMMDVGYDTP